MLIGLLGRSQVGKDTVGHHLQSRGFHRGAFADAVKDCAKKYFNWTGSKASGDPMGRDLLVGIGLMFRAEVSSDWWLQQVKWETRPLVITDVRFPDEVNWIHLLGGTVWKITRDDVPVLDNAADNAVEFCSHDWVVPNDGTIRELYRTVDTLLAKAGNHA